MASFCYSVDFKYSIVRDKKGVPEIVFDESGKRYPISNIYSKWLITILDTDGKTIEVEIVNNDDHDSGCVLLIKNLLLNIF